MSESEKIPPVVPILLVRSRVGKHFARVEWTKEIKQYEKGEIFFAYTQEMDSPEEALAAAGNVIKHQGGLASAPTTR